MAVKQFEISLADLNSQIGTEAGKTRPVLIIQTDLLNNVAHPSTIVCPITTNIHRDSKILRIHLKRGAANLLGDFDIMVDQIRSIDNKRLIKKLGILPKELIPQIKENISLVIGLWED